jgi:hypothetical protein
MKCVTEMASLKSARQAGDHRRVAVKNLKSRQVLRVRFISLDTQKTKWQDGTSRPA